MILGSPWIINRLTGRVRPRKLALAYLLSIIFIFTSTATIIALIMLHFVSGSLLAAMGDACGGLFAAGHGFLAESSWNYLLATAMIAVFFSQMAFLFGGGFRLFRVSHREKSKRKGNGMVCPALMQLVDAGWDQHLSVFPGDGRLEARTIGLLRPRIVISEELTRVLSTGELGAVISHEEAHRSHRDNLLTALGKAVTLTLFYLPGPRLAYGKMLLNLELAADDEAAARSGGSLVVAGALAKIAKASREMLSPAERASGGSAAASAVPVFTTRIAGNNCGLEARLNALIGDSRGKSGSRGKKRSARRLTAVLLVASVLVPVVFSASAFDVAGTDQRQAFICFTEHEQSVSPDGVCPLDHPDHG